MLERAQSASSQFTKTGLSPILDLPTGLLPLAVSMESLQTDLVRRVRVVAYRCNSHYFFMQECIPSGSRRHHSCGSTISYMRQISNVKQIPKTGGTNVRSEACRNLSPSKGY